MPPACFIAVVERPADALTLQKHERCILFKGPVATASCCKNSCGFDGRGGENGAGFSAQRARSHPNPEEGASKPGLGTLCPVPFGSPLGGSATTSEQPWPPSAPLPCLTLAPHIIRLHIWPPLWVPWNVLHIHLRERRVMRTPIASSSFKAQCDGPQPTVPPLGKGTLSGPLHSWSHTGFVLFYFIFSPLCLPCSAFNKYSINI